MDPGHDGEVGLAQADDLPLGLPTTARLLSYTELFLSLNSVSGMSGNERVSDFIPARMRNVPGEHSQGMKLKTLPKRNSGSSMTSDRKSSF